MSSIHKYDYGVIGNGAYLAHIHKSSNVSWMCWPKFDDSFIFGTLLDRKKGGEFSISLADCDHPDIKQYYVTNTNILRTELQADEAHLQITDFAPRFVQYERRFTPLMLIRKIESMNGSNCKIIVRCKPTTNYGQNRPKIGFGSNHIKYTSYTQTMRLHGVNIPMSYIREEKSMLISAPIYLIFSWEETIENSIIDISEKFLRKTRQYWENWVERSTIPGIYQEEVIRSALVLKLHQFEDTGAIIAAATTSLPESPKSKRTWDYRYCWLRDSYYVLTAFHNISHFDELKKFAMYVQNIATKEDMGYQPLYSILGDSNLTEEIIPLAGYLNNTPVRIGNQAHTHIQNDVYGQILLSLLPLFVDKRIFHKNKHISVNLIYNLLANIQSRMQEPDAGLWEFRNFMQLHTYTYLFHWAGSCAAEKIAKIIKDEKMLKIACHLRKQSSEMIEKSYSHKLKVYAQAINTQNMDASLLQLISMNYLDANSPIARQHLSQLENNLRSEEGLFYRYLHQDDFGKPEVTFLVCSFWYVEALACVGKLDKAIQSLDKILTYSNHLNLFSEDIDSKTGSQWGNFPQTYSHVGLINAVSRISNKLDRPIFLT